MAVIIPSPPYRDLLEDLGTFLNDGQEVRSQENSQILAPPNRQNPGPVSVTAQRDPLLRPESTRHQADRVCTHDVAIPPPRRPSSKSTTCSDQRHQPAGPDRKEELLVKLFLRISIPLLLVPASPLDFGSRVAIGHHHTCSLAEGFLSSQSATRAERERGGFCMVRGAEKLVKYGHPGSLGR